MLRDAAQAYIEVLLEKGGSVPVDEGVETGNMPVVTVTVKTSSAIRPLLTLTGVGGNVILQVDERQLDFRSTTEKASA